MFNWFAFSLVVAYEETSRCTFIAMKNEIDEFLSRGTRSPELNSAHAVYSFKHQFSLNE
jgi:hypothetical protein